MSVEHLWKNKNWSNSIIYSGLLKYSVSITVSTWNARTCTLVRKLVCVHPQSQACNLLPGCSCSCSVTGPPGPSAEIPPDIASLFREAVRQTRRCPACPCQWRAACSFSKSICFGRRGKKKRRASRRQRACLLQLSECRLLMMQDDSRRRGEKEIRSGASKTIWLETVPLAGRLHVRSAKWRKGKHHKRIR